MCKIILQGFITKYKKWFILGAVGLGLYVFFFAKLADDKTKTMFEVLKYNIAHYNTDNVK